MFIPLTQLWLTQVSQNRLYLWKRKESRSGIAYNLTVEQSEGHIEQPFNAFALHRLCPCKHTLWIRLLVVVKLMRLKTL